MQERPDLARAVGRVFRSCKLSQGDSPPPSLLVAFLIWQEVFLCIEEAFDDLNSIFAHYAKSGQACPLHPLHPSRHTRMHPLHPSHPSHPSPLLPPLPPSPALPALQAGASGDKVFTMQQTEVTNLSLDCDLAHKAFAMARIHQIMSKSDQLDGNDAAQRAGGDKVR